MYFRIGAENCDEGHIAEDCYIVTLEVVLKELMVVMMLKKGITAEMVLVMESESGCGNGRIISKVEVVTVGALKEVVLLYGGSNKIMAWKKYCDDAMMRSKRSIKPPPLLIHRTKNPTHNENVNLKHIFLASMLISN